MTNEEILKLWNETGKGRSQWGFDMERLKERQRKLAIDNILTDLGLPISDRNIAVDAFDKFHDDYEPKDSGRMSELRKKLWKWKVFEYVRVEVAKRDNPEMILHLQAVAQDEIKRIVAQMVIERLNPTKPRIDFGKMVDEAELMMEMDRIKLDRPVQHQSDMQVAAMHAMQAALFEKKKSQQK